MTYSPLQSYCFEDLAVGMKEVLAKTVMASDVVGWAVWEWCSRCKWRSWLVGRR
jgi:hypothetical protein